MPRFLLEIDQRSREISCPPLRIGYKSSVLLERHLPTCKVTLRELGPPIALAASRTPRVSEGSLRPTEDATVELAGNPFEVTLVVSRTETVIRIPLGSRRQVHARREHDRWLVSDDPRMLMGTGVSRDPDGILSLLELVGPVCPLSPWREIRRLCPGLEYRVSHADLEMTEHVLALCPPSITPPTFPVTTEEEATAAVAKVLDTALERCRTRENGLLLFSGGVDSGLMAARAAQLGWRDLLLVHSTRGPSDAETDLAVRMAKHLGLQIEVYPYDPDAALDFLGEMFDAYTPVADSSMLPTWLLARQILSHHGSEASFAWDGTGADGVFGGIRKTTRWRRVYAIPLPVRRLLGSLYGLSRQWANCSRLEPPLRLLKKSSLWPWPFFKATIHPMSSIAFHAPGNQRRRIAESALDWYASIHTSFAAEFHPMLIYLAFLCGWAMPKPYSVFDASAVDVRYPFVEPDVLTFAAHQVLSWPEELRESKGVLKKLLARSVPHEMVYRPKSGFSVPPSELFANSRMIEAFDAVLEDSQGPFAGFLHRRLHSELRQRLVNQRPLAWYTYEYIWLLICSHHWIVRNEATALEAPA